MIFKDKEIKYAIEELDYKVNSIIAMLKADKIRKATKKEKED